MERDIIKANELFLLPNLFDNKNLVAQLSKIFDDISNKIQENYPLQTDISDFEIQANTLILDSLDLSVNDKIYINDNILYTIDLFDKGHKSISMKPLNSEIPETISYSEKLCKELNETLEKSKLKVVSTVYKTSHYSPLCLVVIQFIDKQKEKSSTVIVDSDFNPILSRLNDFTLSEYSKGIYVQKNLTYFDDDKIYIVKPNQKRFWNLSSAIEDAQNITLEIMSIPE
jgi:hypothetical protein